MGVGFILSGSQNRKQITNTYQIVVLGKTLETPLDCKEIKPVNPKENKPWIFIERTDPEAESSVL